MAHAVTQAGEPHAADGEQGSCAWPTAGHTVLEWTPRAGLEVQVDWLSAEEIARMQRQIAPLGEQWAAARCWVRVRLALRLGCDPAQVPLVTGPRGRPALRPQPPSGPQPPSAWEPRDPPDRARGNPADPPDRARGNPADRPDRARGNPGVGDLNVSHTDHLLVLALSGHRVGVDIEVAPPVREDLLALAEVVGTRREVEQLAALAPLHRADAFQRWWVRKEAVLKAEGVGFLADPRRVHVGVTEADPPLPWIVHDHGEVVDPSGQGRWPRTLLATAHGHAFVSPHGGGPRSREIPTVTITQAT